MKISEFVVSFSEEEALALRSLIEGFIKMQSDLGMGEHSRRMTLAVELLSKLPEEVTLDSSTDKSYKR